MQVPRRLCSASRSTRPSLFLGWPRTMPTPSTAAGPLRNQPQGGEDVVPREGIHVGLPPLLHGQGVDF